ncbi:uncharacterized protein LOC21392624 [Morus notabilis]|uniref:uncharacterized protein LOC21392624 n=1 Tax=Morus notabilis TaxID=981085 RepID=UPI000CED0147|nr:uncharacterized protein LOC21392624 [Morus notabilis]
MDLDRKGDRDRDEIVKNSQHIKTEADQDRGESEKDSCQGEDPKAVTFIPQSYINAANTNMTCYVNFVRIRSRSEEEPKVDRDARSKSKGMKAGIVLGVGQEILPPILGRIQTQTRKISTVRSIRLSSSPSSPNPMDERHPPKRVVVCGGGVIGVCAAYFLSKKGAAVTLVEKSSVACAASGKAGGFLALDWCDGRPLSSLARASFNLHRSLAEDLDGARSYGYRPLTTLSLTVTESNNPPSGSRPSGTCIVLSRDSSKW